MTTKGRRKACQHQEPAQIEAQMASVSGGRYFQLRGGRQGLGSRKLVAENMQGVPIFCSSSNGVTHGDRGLTLTPALTRHHKPGLSNGEVCVLSVFLLKKRTRNGGRRQLGPGKEGAMARKGEAGFSLQLWCFRWDSPGRVALQLTLEFGAHGGLFPFFQVDLTVM